MAADLGGSQISALLESVPGIVNVLRSPVADAIVSMIRAAAGMEAFSQRDAEELVQFAVRRGLIGAAEGERVLEDVKGSGRARPKAAGARKAAARKGTRRTAKKTSAAKAKPKTGSKKPAKKTVKKAAKRGVKKVPSRAAKRR